MRKRSKLQDEKKKNDALNLLKLFGNGKTDDKFDEIIPITRISVGDCPLVETDLIVSEAKYENVIDRQKGTASNPRQTERVPAGIKFDYDIRVKILDDDKQVLPDVLRRAKDVALVDTPYTE